jgi:capsular polysaccharide biosynthesis protein
MVLPMEEEISLRELIEILLKGKWIIVAVTAVAVLISGVLSFFVLEPTYEARATMLVVQPKIEAANSDNGVLSRYLQSITESTQLSLDTYVNLVKNPALLDRVRNRLELDPYEYTIRKMGDIIKVSTPEKTNLIEIVITHTDPELAATMANTLAEEFVEFIDEQSKERVNQSIVVLEQQLASEEEKMNAALDAYTNFLSESRGVAHVEQTYNAKVALLTQFQTLLAQTKVALDTTKAGLAAGEKELANLSPVVITEKSLLEDDLMRVYVSDTTGESLSQLAGLRMESQEVNDAYIALLELVNMDRMAVKQLENKLVSLEDAIGQTAREIETLQIELAEKKAVEERLLNKLKDTKRTYDRLVQKYDEALIASAIDSADAQINLMAPAWVPVSPVGPRKMLNLAVAGMLGVMLGSFIALFRHYWYSTGNSTKLAKGKSC